MKSCKQRRLEVKEKRCLKAEKSNGGVRLNKSSVAADPKELIHNNSCFLPQFYIDVAYSCVDCGSKELWTAKQQKWWYEIAKGNINSGAVRCLSCRNIIKNEKKAQQEHMAAMALKPPHKNEAFFKRRF